MARPPRLRFYRLLLYLFPRRFRQEREREMQRLVLDIWAEQRSEGGRMGPALWLLLVWDIGSHAVRERFAPSRPLKMKPTPLGFGERMATVFADIRYAVRTALRQPTYGLVIITLMALGIAGNAAVFRIFNGLFLRPLPFDHPEQLVDLDETAPQWNLEFVGIAYPDFAEWRESNRTFSGIAVFTGSGRNFTSDGSAERIDILISTYDLADVLGVRPLFGRFFTAEEDVPDGPRVALLSHRFWQQQFGGDETVVGRIIELNNRAYEVIGVLPPHAEFVSDASVWIPLQADPNQQTGWYLRGVGRLNVGVSLDQARADLLSVHRGMVEERSVNETTSPVVNSLRDRYLGEYRLGSAALLGAVGVVLLIACANIAGLMLARSLARGREIAVRVALGASRRRIVQQLLTESVILAVLGALAGTGLGFWGSSMLVARMTEQFPQWVTFDLDWRFFTFTLVVTVGAAVMFGLAPALQAAGTDTRGVLHASTTRTSASIGKRRSMSVLVAGEVALALLLLIVAGLSVRDMQRLQHTDPGYRSENILTYRLALPSAKYENSEQRVAFFEQHVERLRGLPGVLGVAAASSLPLSGHWGWFFQVEGAPERGPDDPNPVVLNRIVTPGYLATMGVTLIAGRPFNEFDGREEGSRAVVVNETFVRLFFEDGVDPVGKRIHTGGESAWMTVVGVTQDVKHYGVDEEMRPGVYQPLRQMPRGGMQVAVRTAVDPAGVVSAVRNELRTADPDLPLYNVMTMRERLDDSLWTRRASSTLIAIFSTVALTLAVAGIYGVISYGVGQRAHEISIRIALGARKAQVVRQVMRQGMRLVGVGAAVGLAAAYAAARVVSGLLVGVSATDPMTYAAVTLVLLAIAALANFIPARRAARTEPMEALRGE